MNIEHIRSLFPVTNNAIYLNNASQSPLNLRVFDRLQNHLNRELNPVDKKGFNRDSIRTTILSPFFKCTP